MSNGTIRHLEQAIELLALGVLAETKRHDGEFYDEPRTIDEIIDSLSRVRHVIQYWSTETEEEP